MCFRLNATLNIVEYRTGVCRCTGCPFCCNPWPGANLVYRSALHSRKGGSAICHCRQLAMALAGFAKGSFGSILLKKSAMVSTAEKYALEIEIFTLSRGFQAQISRSYTKKRDFQQSVRGRSGKTDFFNRIGRSLPIMATKRAAQGWSSKCNDAHFFIPLITTVFQV